MWGKMGVKKDQLFRPEDLERELLLAKVKQSVAGTGVGKAGRSPVNNLKI